METATFQHEDCHTCPPARLISCHYEVPRCLKCSHLERSHEPDGACAQLRGTKGRCTCSMYFSPCRATWIPDDHSHHQCRRGNSHDGDCRCRCGATHA